jgi:hypothetical protein
MYIDPMMDGFQDELRKIAAEAPPTGLMKGKGKYLIPAAAGAAVWETARRANRDRKLGKQVRLQQGG